jgi:hypothetical protein
VRLDANAIPAGATRISAKDFRTLARASALAGRNRFTRDVIKSLPVAAREKIGAMTGDLPSEHDEQAEFVQWLLLREIRHNATPNGGFRAKKTAAELREEGLSPGFPDITCWPEPGSRLPIIYIEFKRKKGGRVSGNQHGWLDYLRALEELGYPVRVHIARGFQEARAIIEREWKL